MIVDADTATGLLLTGVGQVDIRKRANFLIVDDSECLLMWAGQWGWRCPSLLVARQACWVVQYAASHALGCCSQ